MRLFVSYVYLEDSVARADRICGAKFFNFHTIGNFHLEMILLQCTIIQVCTQNVCHISMIGVIRI